MQLPQIVVQQTKRRGNVRQGRCYVHSHQFRQMLAQFLGFDRIQIIIGEQLLRLFQAVLVNNRIRLEYRQLRLFQQQPQIESGDLGNMGIHQGFGGSLHAVDFDVIVQLPRHGFDFPPEARRPADLFHRRTGLRFRRGQLRRCHTRQLIDSIRQRLPGYQPPAADHYRYISGTAVSGGGP